MSMLVKQHEVIRFSFLIVLILATQELVITWNWTGKPCSQVVHKEGIQNGNHMYVSLVSSIVPSFQEDSKFTELFVRW